MTYVNNLFNIKSILGSVITVRDGLGSLNCFGSFKNSGLYVGYDPGEDGVFGGGGDEIINPKASINRVSFRGFENSWVGASRNVQSPRLGPIKYDNGGVRFGMFYGDNGFVGNYPHSMQVTDFLIGKISDLRSRPDPIDPPF